MIATILFYAFTGLVALVVILFLYRRFYAHRYFKRIDVPGPEPHWLLGNLSDFAEEGKRHLVLADWTKKYGKMYGFFEGPSPTLVISDMKMVQQVFVKQFPSFHGRKLFSIQPNPDTEPEGVHMFYARGMRWKRLRTIINPTFSAVKLRAMMPLMKKCLGDVMEVIDERAGTEKEFDIFECYKCLTLDTISECGFGVSMESAKSTTSPLLDSLKKIFHYSFHAPIVVILAIILPEARVVFRFILEKAGDIIGWGPKGVMNKVFAMIESIVRKRKSQPEVRRTDLLQLMLELEDPEAVGKAIRAADQGSVDGAQAVNPSVLKGLTVDEIKAQCFLFMAAGFETTSNALAFATFLLAKNPEVQEKLYNEINEHFPDESVEANYDSVFALKYLDCVINETLRMYPVAAFVINRLSMEDTELAGVHIPAGLPVQVDVWSIHYDNDIYGPVDTSKFYPERFSEDYPSNPDRDASSFLAFGLGPRIRIGMRFALLEAKLALVSILRKYRIEATAKTGDELELNVAQTITPKSGVWVKLSAR